MAHLKETILIIILAIVVSANLYDLWIDYSHGASDWHLVEESVVIILSASAIAWLITNLLHQRREVQALRADLLASQEVSSRRSDQLADSRHRMGEAIQVQFELWGLTRSEREVALLLLKGLSFKEIATVRDTLEKTVRQQASSIYRKADVAGRASFAAWFIEDIL